MPHVKFRRAYVISDLHHRAPFPAIATASVVANETMVTATPKSTSQSSGLNRTQIGVGVASVVAAILLVAVIVYTFRARKSKQINQVSVNEKSSSAPDVVKVDFFHPSPLTVEKPKAVYISQPNTSYDTQVGWVPQIKAHKGIPVASQPLSEKNGRYLETWEPEKELPSSFDSRPAPTRQRTLTPTSPPAPFKSAPRPAELTIPNSDDDSHLPSPLRTASLPEQIALTPRPITNPFPTCLMTVCNTFVPALGDELLVSIGETVQMLDEYDDGWCLVQRSDSTKGIVPRFCLTERR